MPQVIDQMGRTVNVPDNPKRIVSLVPSQTELLFDLGLDTSVVGSTHYCIHPKKKCRGTTRIGGTKKLNLQKISALNPDLIIGNKEENLQSQIEALETHYPVWMSDIETLPDALHMIRAVGSLIQQEQASQVLVNRITDDFNELAHVITAQPRERVAYFIWNDPMMVAGSATFIHHMLEQCGWDNVYGKQGRYPETTSWELQKLNPDRILLSSEPFPFREKHLAEFQSICPDARIEIVDGELFSWYGSRLTRSAAYFQSLRSATG